MPETSCPNNCEKTIAPKVTTCPHCGCNLAEDEGSPELTSIYQWKPVRIVYALYAAIYGALILAVRWRVNAEEAIMRGAAALGVVFLGMAFLHFAFTYHYSGVINMTARRGFAIMAMFTNSPQAEEEGFIERDKDAGKYRFHLLMTYTFGIGALIAALLLVAFPLFPASVKACLTFILECLDSRPNP